MAAPRKPARICLDCHGDIDPESVGALYGWSVPVAGVLVVSGLLLAYASDGRAFGVSLICWAIAMGWCLVAHLVGRYQCPACDCRRTVPDHSRRGAAILAEYQAQADAVSAAEATPAAVSQAAAAAPAPEPGRPVQDFDSWRAGKVR